MARLIHRTTQNARIALPTKIFRRTLAESETDGIMIYRGPHHCDDGGTDGRSIARPSVGTAVVGIATRQDQHGRCALRHGRIGFRRPFPSSTTFACQIAYFTQRRLASAQKAARTSRLKSMSSIAFVASTMMPGIAALYRPAAGDALKRVNVRKSAISS